MIRLNDSRTKLYYISDDCKAVVEVDLKSAGVRLIRIRHLTSFDDSISSIFAYKSMMYILTAAGLAVIYNTVQRKVVVKRPIKVDRMAAMMIARCKERIVVVESLGVVPERPLESRFRAHVMSKAIVELSTSTFEQHATEKEKKDPNRRASTASTLIMIPTDSGHPLVVLSFIGGSMPIKIFRLTIDGRLIMIRHIDDAKLPATITAMRYCDGSFFVSARDKTIRRFKLVLN